MRNYVFVSLLLAFLTGCIADQRNEAHNAPQSTAIYVPPSQNVDTSKLADDIGQRMQVTSNNTQAQLSGLVTAQVSKVADTVKGVEANLKDLLKVNIDNTATLNTSLNNKIDATLQNQIELKANMTNQVAIQNKMDTKLEAIASINAKLDAKVEADAKINTALSAQVGLLNEIKNTTTNIDARAGRDVNMLPPEAVRLLVTNLYISLAVIVILCIVGTIALTLSFKAARIRESNRTKMEREERVRLFNLLTEALMHVPADQATRFRRMLHTGQPEIADEAK